MSTPPGYGIPTAGGGGGSGGSDHHFTPWLFFLYSVFPIPLFFLLLLSLPLPKSLKNKTRRAILWVLERIIFFQVKGGGG